MRTRPPAASKNAISIAAVTENLNSRANAKMTVPLSNMVAAKQSENKKGPRPSSTPTDTKNNPSSSPLEGLNLRLDLLAIFGFSQQQARDEGAQRHREAGDRCHQACTDYHRQAGRDKHLVAFGFDHRPHHGAQYQSPYYDQDQQTDCRRCEGREEPGYEGLTLLPRQKSDRYQERRNGQILKQKNREYRSAGGCVLPFLFSQKRHHDRCGG